MYETFKKLAGFSYRKSLIRSFEFLSSLLTHRRNGAIGGGAFHSKLLNNKTKNNNVKVVELGKLNSWCFHIIFTLLPIENYFFEEEENYTEMS